MEALIIDRVSGISPYKQVISHITALIRQGKLRQGDRLPSVREMGRILSLSTNSVQKAVHQLKMKGFINGRAGDGLFVADPLPDASADTPPVLWVEPAQWPEPGRTAINNKFHSKYPAIRVLEHVGGGADLLWLDDNFIPQHFDFLEDITDLVLELYGRTENDAKIFDKLRHHGRLFMLPLRMNVQVMACNVDVFERRGVPLPSASWDWAEFLETARALTRKEEGMFGYMLNCHWDAFIGAVWQAGGNIYSSEGAQCRLDEPTALEAGSFIRACGPFAMLGDPAEYAMQRQTFIAGKVGMMQVGAGGYQVLNQAKCRWLARPLPRGREAATLWNARGYGVVRRPRQSAIAKRYLREHAEYENWPENRRFPYGLTLHKELEARGKTEATYLQALSSAHSWLADVTPSARKRVHVSALNIINAAMRRLAIGPEPVGEVMEKVKTGIESIIAAHDGGSTL